MTRVTIPGPYTGSASPGNFQNNLTQLNFPQETDNLQIMMLDYEWANPAAAAAAAMLLFGDAGEVDPTPFDQYGGNGLAAGDFFAPTAAGGLFSPVGATAASGQRYGMGMPSAVTAPARIGLNLGVRTYFSSASPEEEMGIGRVCRRRVRLARCQAEGCGADLTHAKHYHRRHKVCEFHSKASIVIAAGLSQRFCQQCSRFHVLSEFDQGKRSCRKRLADHNRRRRKSQDLATINNINNNNDSNNNNNNKNTVATANNNNNNAALLHFESSSSSNNNNTMANMGSSMDKCNHETGSAITRVPSPAMALGLSCSAMTVSPALAGLSGSSTTTVSSPPRVSFFSHLGDFRGHEHRFLSWDDGDDSCSIRSPYQSK